MSDPIDRDDWTIGIDMGSGKDETFYRHVPAKGHDGDWLIYDFLCRICARRWHGAIPDSADEDNVECPSCHNMTGEPEEAKDDGDCGLTA